MAVAHHMGLCAEDLNDEERYILEQLKAAASSFKRKDLHDAIEFLDLANGLMVECGVANIKVQIVKSVIHNRVLCLGRLNMYSIAFWEIYTNYSIPFGWDDFASGLKDFLLQCLKSFMLKNHPTVNPFGPVMAQDYLEEVITCLCEIAADVIERSEKEKGLITDKKKALMVNLYCYEAEELDAILRMFLLTCIRTKEKILRAHALLVLALQSTDANSKKECSKAVICEVKMALKLGNDTIPPEGYYYQGKAYEILGQWDRALGALTNIEGEEPDYVQELRKSLQSLSDAEKVQKSVEDEQIDYNYIPHHHLLYERRSSASSMEIEQAESIRKERPRSKHQRHRSRSRSETPGAAGRSSSNVSSTGRIRRSGCERRKQRQSESDATRYRSNTTSLSEYGDDTEQDDRQTDTTTWSTSHIPTHNTFASLMPLDSPSQNPKVSPMSTTKATSVQGTMCRVAGKDFLVPEISSTTAYDTKGYQKVGAPRFVKPVHPTLSPVTKSVSQLLASFPLKDRDIRMACMECFKRIGRFGKSAYEYHPQAVHRCRMDNLIVREKNKPDAEWAKIRPLPEFKENAPTKFSQCPKFLDGELCRFGEAQCRFAHYADELLLWKIESNDRKKKKVPTATLR